jgi:hypothetical protein
MLLLKIKPLGMGNKKELGTKNKKKHYTKKLKAHPKLEDLLVFYPVKHRTI